MAEVGWAAATALLHLLGMVLVVTPLIWWRARRDGHPPTRSGGGRLLVAAGVVYVVAQCLLSLPPVGFFAELDWNWQNKLLLLTVTVLAIWSWPGLTWREIGVCRPRRGWWVPVVLAFAVMLGLNLLGGPSMQTTTETFLFQAIMPGLDEELLYRGLLLILLHRALTGRRAMWRADVGWEVPITCVLFGLVHGLHLQAGWQVMFEPAQVVITGLLGLLLVWIRIRWASLWPAILAHNAINTAAVVANTMPTA